MGAAGSKTPRTTTKEGRQAGAMFDEGELHVIMLTYKDLAGLSKGDKRGESIDKATFLQNFPVPGLVGDRLFHALDSNKTGRISFDDFVVGLAVCCRGSLEQKMHFIFGVYDMDGDGFISGDELLLMLNQVPRTLLSIGGESRDAAALSPVDWKALTINGEGGKGAGRVGAPAITPHSTRVGREGRFFQGDVGGAPPAPSVGRSRARSAEPRPRCANGRSERGCGKVSTAASAFTNESIAEQALKEFGSGDGKPLTFEQFQSWAQQTPAIQALLQGAFPSDAHFSLATSPRARRVSCESLVAPGTPRRSSGSMFSSTPTTSGAAATAVAAVAGWSASASASRPSSRRSTPNHQRQPSAGVDSTNSARSFFTGTIEPLGAKTPSRKVSRNTSYDNLLRSPLVGSGLGAVFVSPLPRSTSRGSGAGWAQDDVGSKLARGGESKNGARNVWKWGQGGEGGLKTPNGQSKGTWSDDDHSNTTSVTPAVAAAGAVPGTPHGGIRTNKESKDIPPPLTTGRLRRKTPSAASPSCRVGCSPAVSAMASPASSRVRNFQRRNSGSSSFSNSDDVASVASRSSSRPPSIASSTVVGSNSDFGAPPKTPLRPWPDRNSPPGTTELTRKARKLAMMAKVAETVAASPSRQPASCQNLLALANAAAVAEAAPAPAPRRGKLMRYLSADAGLDKRGGSTPSRGSRLMRLAVQESDALDGGGTSTNRVKRMTLRRSNSLSEAEQNRQSNGTRGGGNDKKETAGVATPRRENRKGANGDGVTFDENRRAKRASLASAPPHAKAATLPARRGARKDELNENSESSGAAANNGDVALRNGGKAHEVPPEPIMLPSSGGVSLGVPVSNISPLLPGGPAAVVGMSAETVGAEAVVRDCLYNSHGMVALDGYLWKPGSLRIVRRWMMLVDNTLYYFIKPGDRKPRGVISLPGCIAEAVNVDEDYTSVEGVIKKEPRKARVPKGFFGLKLFRPNNHGRDTVSRLLLAKTAGERDEWVAELRVASRVVPLEEHFEVRALLRKGAFASVHRCIRKDTREDFAVKVIDKTSLSSHEKFLLRGEIGALKLVSHPNVVRLEAVHEDPRSIAIVMTLCRGGDLWDKVRSQPSRCFTAPQAKTVMRPLCEAVSYLHTLGILHRDIKPENILLVDNGSGNLGGVTLSDFGFSHQVSPKSRLACGKQLMGTPSYMAPESILHGMYGKEVDWFSCGCVLYMMLMGRAPFAGNSPSEIFRNTCHGRLGLGRGGTSLWDKLPAAARELIVGLMQLDHNLRFTGEQAINHRWLQVPEEEPVSADNGRAAGQRQESGGTEGARTPRVKRRVSHGTNDKYHAGGGRGKMAPSTAVTPSTSCASSSSSTGGGAGGEVPPGILRGGV